jgi:long-chain fatty acid transport protein
MKQITKGLFSLAASALLVAPAASWATNGYFVPGTGAKADGMGGVGIAYAQDSLAGAVNPAGIVDVGTRADIGVGFFNPERRSAVPAGQPVGFGQNVNMGFYGDSWSNHHLFPVPNMGFAMQWNDKLAFSLAVVANGGMNTNYNANFFNFTPTNPTATSPVGVDLMQLFVPMTAAYKVTEKQAVGASVIYVRQRFAARGLESFIPFQVSSDNAHLTNMGYDYSEGIGLRLGWRGKFMDDRLTIGATYAPKTDMSRFDLYRGLFANHGDFDIPENYGVGLAFKVTDAVNVAFDYVRINFAGVPSVGNPGPDNGVLPFPCLAPGSSCKTGLDQGLGFGWHNQDVFKLGVDYRYDKNWTFRAGYNYGKSPIDDKQLTFNLLAPATTEQHYHVGLTYQLSDDNELTLAYWHAARHKQSQCRLNMLGCAEFEMYQNQLDIAYSWKF